MGRSYPAALSWPYNVPTGSDTFTNSYYAAVDSDEQTHDSRRMVETDGFNANGVAVGDKLVTYLNANELGGELRLAPCAERRSFQSTGRYMTIDWKSDGHPATPTSPSMA